MKVLLREDVSGVGHKGDLCEVSDGYARNFLLPRGLAMRATEGVDAQAEGMRRARAIRDAQDREAAEEIAKTLVSKVLTITARASDEGRLFGSIASADVAATVAEQTGVELDRRQVVLDDHIKDVGTHTVMARLHADVEFPLTVEVIAE
ncbi:MAG: 50S ribosomal protein L9 [Acidimicrobiales bacterium]